jgi:hypothetical protein
VINDCLAGDSLSRTYTPAEYRSALANLPADADQYSSCRDIITGALRESGLSGGKSKPGSASSSGGSWGGGNVPGVPPGVDPLATATDSEKAAIAQAAKSGDEPVILDGTPVDPSELGASGLNSPSDLPTPLLVVLGVLVLGTLAAATRWSIIYVRKHRSAS